MEDSDHLEQKFKSAFSGFKQEPPSRVWENLSHSLHPAPRPEMSGFRMAGSNLLPEKQVRRYIAFAAAAIVLFLAVVYVASKDHHFIRGHAYAGEVRLSRGVAVLFRVSDKVKPWDSIHHYQSAMIDNNGYYQFSQVEPGSYLLRIVPEENSEAAKTFLPSWFDQHENPDSSHVIIVNTDDVDADVHLITKGGDSK